MRLGNLTINGNLFLAPLAGISNYPFRLLARRYGAAMCYTEMVSADAVIRCQERTIRMLDMPPDEHPVGVQLFGSKPEYMAGAVKVIEKYNPDLIDLNIGCPVRKVIKKNGGAALLKNLTVAGEIISAAVENCRLPVTIKMRTGWDKKSDVFLQMAEIAEKAGVTAITLHPRSRTEGYDKKSDWSKIALLKQAVSIPVIGNGDIIRPRDAEEMFKQTGCDAVMIGREAMRNPYIFKQVEAYLERGENIPDMTVREKIGLALEHARLMVRQFGEKNGTIMMRKHLAWYSKGFRAGAELRRQLKNVNCYNDIERLFTEYLENSEVKADEQS